MRTEHRDLLATSSDTLPRTRRPIAERPWDPTTIRSASHCSAFRINSEEGVPARTSPRTCQVGKYDLRRKLAVSASSFACFKASDTCLLAWLTIETTRSPIRAL